MEASNVGQRRRPVVGHTNLLLHLRCIHHVDLDKVPRPNQEAFLLRKARRRKRAQQEQGTDQFVSTHTDRSRSKTYVCIRNISDWLRPLPSLHSEPFPCDGPPASAVSGSYVLPICGPSRCGAPPPGCNPRTGSTGQSR